MILERIAQKSSRFYFSVNNFVQTTPELKNLVDENYIYYHLNYSPKNKNEKIFAQYGNPGEKYGYPVFIVLDKNGKQIHTQEGVVS